MLLRLQSVPRHTRLSWLWPIFCVLAALALSIQTPQDREVLAHAALFDASHRRLYLRSGLHWTGSTPLANVKNALAYDQQRDADTLKIAIDVKPNLTLEFIAPVRMLGLYWVEKEVTSVALHVDDPGAFLASLQG